MNHEHRPTVPTSAPLGVWCGAVALCLGLVGCGNALPPADATPADLAPTIAPASAGTTEGVAAMSRVATRTATARPLHARLSWPASVDSYWVTNYVIGYGSASGNYTGRLNCGTTTSGTVSNLARGQFYYLAVAAQNAAGIAGPWSREIIFPTPMTNINPERWGKPMTNPTAGKL